MTAADSAARSGDATRICSDIADRVWRGISSSKVKLKLESTASILQVGELASDFGRALSSALVPRIIKALSPPPPDDKQAWRLAWSLRSMLNQRVGPHVEAKVLCSVLDNMRPCRKYGVARGEIAAVLGELKEVAAVACLCRNYLAQSDEHERLWIIHSLWQLAHHELSTVDVRAVRATCQAADTPDNYERARHWAQLTLRLIQDRQSTKNRRARIIMHKD